MASSARRGAAADGADVGGGGRTMMVTGRRVRRASVALFAVLATWTPAHAGVDLPTELPADSQALSPAERRALLEFQQDPTANGKALLRLGTGSARDLPLVVVLAAADVHLRAGRYGAATRFFREAARRQAGPPWGDFAPLGLGWTALARRDFDAAAKYYRQIDPASPLASIARVMTAWLTALRGRYAEAQGLFDATANAPGLPPNVQQVALLGAAYVRYWRGAFDDAATAFERLVSPPSLLGDDARYGAAWARVKAGRLDIALPALVALAEDAPADAPIGAAARRPSDAAVMLAPSSVTRSGRESTARISGFAGPDARMVAIFDGDGSTLARAALAMLVRRGEVRTTELPPTVAATLPDVGGAVATAARGDIRPAARAAVAPVPPAEPRATVAGSSWWRAWSIAMAVLVLAIVLAMRRRSEQRPSTPLR